jgi:hypothetical protein
MPLKHKIRTTVNLDREDYEYLKELSRKFGFSLSDTARWAIKNFLMDYRKRLQSQVQAQTRV